MQLDCNENIQPNVIVVIEFGAERMVDVLRLTRRTCLQTLKSSISVLTVVLIDLRRTGCTAAAVCVERNMRDFSPLIIQRDFV